MMRGMMLMALLGVVVLAGEGWGQTAANTPSSRSLSEEMLLLAIQTNPDLRVALAKLAEAEAEVARTRLKVMQKVLAAQQTLVPLRAEVQEAEKHLKYVTEMSARGKDEPQAKQITQRLAPLKTKLAEAEAELDYLLGKIPASKKLQPTTGEGTTRLWQSSNITSVDRLIADTWAVRPLPAPTADRLRKALNHKVNLKLNEVSARDFLELLKKDASGLHLQAPTKGDVWNEKVTAALLDVPFGAALQLLEDVLVGHRIVVREYGLFIVPSDKVPPGSLLLGDFWRDAVKTDKPASSPSK